MGSDDLLTVREVAAIVGINPKNFDTWRKLHGPAPAEILPEKGGGPRKGRLYRCGEVEAARDGWLAVRDRSSDARRRRTALANNRIIDRPWRLRMAVVELDRRTAGQRARRARGARAVEIIEQQGFKPGSANEMIILVLADVGRPAAAADIVARVVTRGRRAGTVLTEKAVATKLAALSRADSGPVERVEKGVYALRDQ